jgi:ribosomal protein S12 methylthiotransferase
LERADRKTYNIGVISLGCDKNRVDTEKMLYRVKMYGHNIVNDIRHADLVIVNTCAFLQSSRKESIETTLEAWSESGGKPIIMTGCLPQKFIDEFFDTFTEVGGFLGTGDYDRINEAIEAVMRGERVNWVGSCKSPKDETGRVVTTAGHYAFLMIADGCSNRCTYCLIPQIRGRYRSFKMETILDEAKKLLEGGAKELILVAQDTTRYGKDLYGEYSLVTLLRELSKLEGMPDGAIRLMYCYPELVSDELIDEIKRNDKIIKYIDIPAQHISDRVLKGMGRPGADKFKGLIKKLRSEIPRISVRSTFILGFPGESEEDFKELCDFLREFEIDNAGFFAYSREKGTRAHDMDGQVHHSTKKRRLAEANFIQQEIYQRKNARQVGKVIEVTCDGFDEDRKMYYGRTYRDAPLCDKLVYITAKESLKAGDKCGVLIESCGVYDLYGSKAKEEI